MSELKKCSKCEEIKPFSEFSKRKKSKDNLQNICKYCSSINSNAYFKTKKGVYTRIYGDQKSTSKRRGHKLPNYTKKQLIIWMGLRGFDKLFKTWVKSGYNKDLKPSCDRLNDALPYTLDNLRLVTWEENNNKGYEDMRKGLLISGTPQKAIIGINKSTGDILEFYSQKEAERQLNVSSGNISLSCQGKRKSAGGYMWKYKSN